VTRTLHSRRSGMTLPSTVVDQVREGICHKLSLQNHVISKMEEATAQLEQGLRSSAAFTHMHSLFGARYLADNINSRLRGV